MKATVPETKTGSGRTCKQCNAWVQPYWEQHICEEVRKNLTVALGQGYTCSNCEVWIPDEHTFHICPDPTYLDVTRIADALERIADAMEVEELKDD